MEKFKLVSGVAAVIFALVSTGARAESQVVFVPEFPAHSSLPGVMAGSTLAFSGDAAEKAFEILLKNKNALRAVAYDANDPKGTGYQEVSSSQISCMRILRMNGTTQNTYCSIHMDRERGAQAWGVVQTDNEDYLDKGLGSHGAASAQKVGSSITVKKSSARTLALTIAGPAASMLKDGKFSSKIVQCTARSCVLSVLTRG